MVCSLIKSRNNQIIPCLMVQVLQDIAVLLIVRIQTVLTMVLGRELMEV